MDIPVLCDYLLGQIAGEERYGVSEEELERLMLYSWPGNVRELRNVLERAVILQRGPLLEPSRFLSCARVVNRVTPVPPKSAQAVARPGRGDNGQLLTLKEIERLHIATVLEAHAGNQTLAARALDIGLSTLKRKIKAFGLSRHPAGGR